MLDLSLAEWVCLALVAEEPRHGWALVKDLEPGGPVGSVWSLSRALTYRATEQLEAKGLVTAGDAEPGRGPNRVVLTASRGGVGAVEHWLVSPVRHVRDLRTEFLLKATLLRRRGADLAPLLDAQEAELSSVLAALSSDDGDGSPVALWRRESADAAQRFFARLRSTLPD